MAPVRPPARPAARTVASAPVAAPASGILSLDFYGGGFLLPEGDYAMLHDVQLYQPLDKNNQPRGNQRLGVMLTAYPLDGGEPRPQFLSMGSKAHESWMPSENGKGVVPIPGSPGQTLNNQTNWALYLKSLHDCDPMVGQLAQGNDLSVVDGVWVHTQNVPEPEGRKGFASDTNEAALMGGEQQKRQGLVPIVSEILEGGKPWEGGGGFEFQPAPQAAPAPATAAARPTAARPQPVASKPAAAARPAAPAAAATARPAPARRTAPVAAPEPVVEEAVEGEDDPTYNAFLDSLGDTFGQDKYSSGLTRTQLRVEVVKAMKAKVGEQAALPLINQYFAGDDALNSVIGQLGYVSANGQVRLAQ